MKDLETIGRAELVDIVDFGLSNVAAKIDTGADGSTIWVSEAYEKEGVLHCVFFGPSSPHYTGTVVTFTSNYTVTRVANSFGHKELRYKVGLRIRVKGRLIRARFTLSDRSLKTYPILLGRRLLKDKFVVDVAQGQPLHDIELEKAKHLQDDLKKLKIRNGREEVS